MEPRVTNKKFGEFDSIIISRKTLLHGVMNTIELYIKLSCAEFDDRHYAAVCCRSVQTPWDGCFLLR